MVNYTEKKGYTENFPEDFSISYRRHYKSEQSRPHIHNQYEILFVLSENLNCIVDGELYKIKPNSIVLFNNLQFHYSRLAEEGLLFERFVIRFAPEFCKDHLSSGDALINCFLGPLSKTPTIIELDNSLADELKAQFHRLVRIYEGSRSSESNKLLHEKLILSDIIVTIYDEFLRANPCVLNEGKEKKWAVVSSVLQYIHRNFKDQVSLEELAATAYVSKNYLCTLFKDCMGITPHQYVINSRIAQAKQLLACNYSVDDCCRLSGFNNLSHFSRCFKQSTGISPKQYQQKFQSEGFACDGQSKPTY